MSEPQIISMNYGEPVILREIVGTLPVSWLVWHNHGNEDPKTKVFHLAEDGICEGCEAAS
jgi:hypothetical protein